MRRKQKFDLGDWTNANIGMRCRTEEEAKIFCQYLHDHGRQWASGKSYISFDCWQTYKDETVYLFNDDTYTNIYDEYAKITLSFDNYDWSDVSLTPKEKTPKHEIVTFARAICNIFTNKSFEEEIDFCEVCPFQDACYDGHNGLADYIQEHDITNNLLKNYFTKED